MSSDQSTYLLKSRAEAAHQLERQITKGRELGARISADFNKLSSTDIMQAALAWMQISQEFDRWNAFNREVLKRILSSDEWCKEYEEYAANVEQNTTVRGQPEQQFVVAGMKYASMLQSLQNRLTSFIERLELLPESPQQQRISEAADRRTNSKKVFIVHGHDDAAKQAVARFIEKLGFESIILDERASRGATIIEKVEEFADVSFAVVLLTPDDVGAAKVERDSLHPRARQNVVFELGYFLGRLGRKRVGALVKGNIEVLSDFSGVVWISMDRADWNVRLAKEMKAAGLDIDLNKLA